MNVDQEIGGVILKARNSLGLTQAEVAESASRYGLGFRQQTILKIEKGQRAVSFWEAVVLAEVLGVDVDHFQTRAMARHLLDSKAQARKARIAALEAELKALRA